MSVDECIIQNQKEARATYRLPEIRDNAIQYQVACARSARVGREMYAWWYHRGPYTVGIGYSLALGFMIERWNAVLTH